MQKKKNYSQKIRVMSFLRGTIPDLIVQMRKLRQRFSNLPKVSQLVTGKAGKLTLQPTLWQGNGILESALSKRQKARKMRGKDRVEEKESENKLKPRKNF